MPRPSCLVYKGCLAKAPAIQKGVGLLVVHAHAQLEIVLGAVEHLVDGIFLLLEREHILARDGPLSVGGLDGIV